MDPTPAVQQQATVVPWEARLPSALRRFNSFAENWIFAFIVAMAVRHFALEAFRIPTASMEPMLYGDPAFSRSDHVVVDKLFFRFKGVDRWDVTVFQFPQPEIEAGNDAQTAIGSDGQRLDRMFVRPLMYRNFVKRAVILPGDRFHIANGDVFLEQPDKGWAIARKPEDVQDALWQEIYRHGAQEGYVPWRAAEGAKVAAEGGALTLTVPQGASIGFDQPLRNLYLKPGKVGVARNHQLAQAAEAVVEVSMTEPQFTVGGRRGSIWDLSQWKLWRLTSADLDNQGHGRVLNESMDEYVGDLRIIAEVGEVTGSVVLRLAEGVQQAFDLRLEAGRWELLASAADQPARRLAGGETATAGRSFALANVDDQVVLSIDGETVHSSPVAAADPQRMRSSISWSGAGAIRLAGLRLERDIHYCANGFLKREDAAFRSGRLATDLGSIKAMRDMLSVRAQMRGVPEVVGEQQYAAWGYSPETAITAPPGAYLMLGDNSPLSWDGRNWGWVPEKNLRGRALAVVLPFSRWRLVR